MPVDVNSDQDLLRETTAKYLTNNAPLSELRLLRDDPAGYSADYWRGGADLGWVSLMISEDQGGGSVSGRGLIDLTLIAYEFGRHAAPGPLVANNVVAYALSTESNGGHLELLQELAAGTRTATWCYAEPQPNYRSDVALQVRVDDNHVVLSGVKRPVESAGTADQFLVTGRTGAGLTQVLVPREAPGVSIEPMKTVDTTRRFGVVRFDDVRLPLDNIVGELGLAADQVERQLQLAVVLLNAESVGAMEAAFDMTVTWAFDRYSFGRPLASYQELKHRFADMKSWLEASHAVSDAAASAVCSRSVDAPEVLSVAKSFLGDYSVELVQDCVQIHGGIGLTFEHRLHFFLRRVTLNRTLLGTPADHRQRLADILERQELRK
jgi:alkylation response protein AidB-like acyl-CoA dehydrogenase